MNEIKQEEIKPKIKKSISVPKIKIDKEMQDYISNFDKQKEIESFDKIYNEKIKKQSIKKPKTPKIEVKPEVIKPKRRIVNNDEEYKKAEEEVYKEARKLAPKLKNFIYKDNLTPEERELLKQNMKERDEFIQSYIRKNRPIYKQKDVYLN